MLCEQVLGKLHDYDITGKTIEYVDIEWHEAFKKIHNKITDFIQTVVLFTKRFVFMILLLILNDEKLIKLQCSHTKRRQTKVRI